MDVAVLYSGGKDSTLAIEYALKRKWNIKYLLSVKPNRTDCYLFHYATVEQTKDLAKILGLRHIYTTCNVASPQKEAAIIRDIVEKNRVDALILGGTGLQETQLKVLQRILMPLNIEVFATHAGLEHEDLMEDMINRGYKIIITQIASDGLGKEWLGIELDKENFQELKMLSEMYGFHIGFEGGYADSLVIDGPILDHRLEILDAEKVVDGKYNFHLKINKTRIVKKPIIIK